MTKSVAILGASGYTGAELVRIIAGHPDMEIAALSADRKAGMAMADVFPHLRHLDLPELQTMDAIDFSGIDLAFAALPHGLMHAFAKSMPDHLKVVDLSADFRLRDADAYKAWYGLDHTAMDLQPDVAFGLPEFYRDDIADARITANTGCYVATTLLPLIPLLRAGVIAPQGIVVDAKSGVSGAGRAPNEATLFSEVNEGFKAYGVGAHRHMGELDQELSLAAGRPVTVSFTPHLVPMTRGMQATIYAAGDANAVHDTLVAAHQDAAFVDVLPMGEVPQVQHVRGSNRCRIGVIKDRVKDRVIVISVLDNLMKGASGQAVQNANLMLGLDERAGLMMAPMFP
ncbi:N-acetyl-gamma-glutamyl-phosphate reductase [Octadecabacter sp. R77987]|uniref:N-acetyl-gamma-glutamyl-phosphate reductase n=1 Tax=Octadecabacter sp. R77987 TaxID=3093874 RepID=UPI00367244B3